MQNLIEILNAGDVLRYHAAGFRNQQTLAQHQWEVATILPHIYENCSLELLKWALIHDVGEAFTGDIPAPVKKRVPELKVILDKLEKEHLESLGVIVYNVSAEEKLALKWADYLSGMYWCRKCLRQGDRAAFAPFTRFAKYLSNIEVVSTQACRLKLALEKSVQEIHRNI